MTHLDQDDQSGQDTIINPPLNVHVSMHYEICLHLKLHNAVPHQVTSGLMYTVLFYVHNIDICLEYNNKP